MFLQLDKAYSPLGISDDHQHHLVLSKDKDVLPPSSSATSSSLPCAHRAILPLATTPTHHHHCHSHNSLPTQTTTTETC
ncbi:hypothetical protein PCASD_06782 [Puccinia coronata f. sp. avenae]|uniref:Uncharacterized protein n=1 Tax=Puccinia coronata f. sp. avenae TaxID=200324 RepID=A0A2N5V0L1_9BASI|nr:hypothetical protein PCASD_06782 [Puccinia coronata f. sp. avenae]